MGPDIHAPVTMVTSALKADVHAKALATAMEGVHIPPSATAGDVGARTVKLPIRGFEGS